MSYPTAPACLNCTHYKPFTKSVCDAYPNGIPTEIYLNGNPHTSAVPGDHGIRFEEATPAQLKARDDAQSRIVALLDKGTLTAAQQKELDSLLQQYTLERAVRKGGPGSGNFNHAGVPGEQGGSLPGASNAAHPNVKAHPRDKGYESSALTEDSREGGILRTKVVSAWAQKTGVTGATELASIARGLKRGLTLEQSVKQTYDRRDAQRRKALGDELFAQQQAEGRYPRPDAPRKDGPVQIQTEVPHKGFSIPHK